MPQSDGPESNGHRIVSLLSAQIHFARPWFGTGPSTGLRATTYSTATRLTRPSILCNLDKLAGCLYDLNLTQQLWRRFVGSGGPMSDGDRKVVSVGSRIAKFIGSKATRERKMQAAAMQAEFTLRDTLIILCYLSRDPDSEIAAQARKNLIPAARTWFTRPDRPELPEPIHAIVLKVIEKIGLGKEEAGSAYSDTVVGNIGLLGLGEIIQAVDHNNRTAHIVLEHEGSRATIYTESGKVVGAVSNGQDGLDAVYRAFGWLHASFKYSHAEPGAFANPIRVNTLNLVMDALEKAPEEDPFQNQASREWRVEGSLKIMNIFEIAEIFEMNSKQAVCRLIREAEEGTLYFKNGRIANAALAEMAGMEAACHLLAWPNAQFIITRGGEGIPEVIHVGMQNLVIEAMRLLDEGVTATERIASELAVMNELFEGRDIITLPVLEKVRLVFAEDQMAREVLEADANPVVRKAIKVKISKTVHKYLSSATDHNIRLKAAKGVVPLSTTEKLVLLSYLSHDESQEIREQARQTLESLDMPTYRKGFGADLHPSVMDFLIRETVKDPALINFAASCETILEETALHILNTWKSPAVLQTMLENRRLLERSPAVVYRLREVMGDDSRAQTALDVFEEAILQGQTDLKVEGPLHLVGLGGLLRAARQGNRSGTIVLESSAKSGRVFFKKGKLIGATCGDLQGLSAIRALLDGDQSRFRYTLRTRFHTENIDHAETDEILAWPSMAPREADSQSLRLITGGLAVMDVYEILSALEGTPAPVAVTVVCEEGTGEVVRDRGRVLHVHVEGKETPLQAMAAISSWSGTRFLARKAVDGYPVTVDKPLQDFFSEAMRLMPEEMTRVARPGELPEWELSESEYESLYHKILEMGVAEKIKLAFLGSKEARDILVRDSNKLVAVAVVKSPKIQESEIESISKSKHVCEDVLRQIASTKEWAKSYTIKLNLASNSKTPLPIAMKFLPHFRELDLRRLAKSKNVSSVLATQARRMAEAKGGD